MIISLIYFSIGFLIFLYILLFDDSFHEQEIDTIMLALFAILIMWPIGLIEIIRILFSIKK